GTAGNIVANRLSENPSHSVLASKPAAQMLVFWRLVLWCAHTPQDWNYTMILQTALNGRSLAYTSLFHCALR
ncbi:hypothetical protein B0H17DRAFT_940771, partial [Mycena rosella]